MKCDRCSRENLPAKFLRNVAYAQVRPAFGPFAGKRMNTDQTVCLVCLGERKNYPRQKKE